MALPSVEQIWNNVKAATKRITQKAVSQTFNPTSSDGVVTAPLYTEHMTDLFASRQANDSRALMRDLFKHDPDVSAAVGAYLTLADTPMNYFVRAHTGEIMVEETKTLHSLVRALTSTTDYTKGFESKPGLQRLCQELRYMTLLRGSIGAELVVDKNMAPSHFQQVDMADVEWVEKKAGQPKPVQIIEATGDRVDLNVANFFVSYHRRDPLKLYSYSDFVSAINTIAARQQVINDLYRIMRITGFPRMSIKVMEEVVVKSMPASIRDNPVEYKTWLRDRMRDIKASFTNLRADEAFIHYDSAEPKILNDKAPGVGIDISKVIEVLNSQNQAALKTMATIIGRGTSGVNTASVEARIAAMNADQLNLPLKEFFERAFTFLISQYGILGYVEVNFEPAELRPNLELEPQRVLRATRLKTDLSLGLITDIEYHLWLYGRLPPEGVPLLSGTGFEASNDGLNTDSATTSGNSLERSIGTPGSKSAKSNNKG